jgi:hypothetical protein
VRLGIHVEPEFEEDLLDVGFDGALGHEEAARDRLVGESFGDEAEDLSLAVAQFSEQVGATAASYVVAGSIR